MGVLHGGGRMTKRYVIAVNLVLITVGAWFCVDMFYTVAINRLRSAFPVSVSLEGSVEFSGTEAVKPVSAYSAIARRNLFKAEKTGAVRAPVIDVDNLKKTDLALKLVGTVSGPGENSYAIIESTKDRKQGLYKVGDSIENAVVKHILRRKVVLTVNGVDEILEMAEGDSEGRLAPNRNPYYGRRGTASRTVERAASVRRLTLDRQRIQNAFENVNALMRTVRIRPHFTNGRPDGLSLDSVSADSVFREMGLQSRDIIVGVNGRKIRTVDDCMDVYNSLKSKSSVVLEVNRDGKRQIMHYNIK
ncbi:MAG: hypothetical protein B5M56_01630 [Desulfococcus sp. 4484_241]|nr:MAG: hypothetical protein B5M56_01630 [Desulfococcus sp. 4484_241]